MKKACKVKGCKNRVYAKGECRTHRYKKYQRKYKKTEKYKKRWRKYQKTEKYKKYQRKYLRKYQRNRYKNDPVFRENVKRANRINQKRKYWKKKWCEE